MFCENVYIARERVIIKTRYVNIIRKMPTVYIEMDKKSEMKWLKKTGITLILLFHIGKCTYLHCLYTGCSQINMYAVNINTYMGRAHDLFKSRQNNLITANSYAVRRKLHFPNNSSHPVCAICMYVIHINCEKRSLKF